MRRPTLRTFVLAAILGCVVGIGVAQADVGEVNVGIGQFFRFLTRSGGVAPSTGDVITRQADGSVKFAASAATTTSGSQTVISDDLLVPGSVYVGNGERVIWGNGPTIMSGSGAPESVAQSPKGSIYLRDDGSTGTSVYIKEAGGSGSSTGWVALGAGGGGAGGISLRYMAAWGVQPISGNAPAFDTLNGHSILAFDDGGLATDETAEFEDVMPSGFGGNGLDVTIGWTATATSGNVYWSVAFEDMSQAAIDSDSFATALTGTSAASGSSNTMRYKTISFTSTNLDSLAGGHAFRVRVKRFTSDAADTMSGDAKLVSVVIDNDS